MLTLGVESGDEILVAQSRLRVERFEPNLDMATVRLWLDPRSSGDGVLLTVSVHAWLEAQCKQGAEELWFRTKLSTTHRIRSRSGHLVIDADADISVTRSNSEETV